MLRKIDCIMIRVDDIEAAAAYYAEVFGLRPQWSGDGAIGLVFPESDAEIVLHNDPGIPSSVEVHYLVDDVIAAVAQYEAHGCRVLVAPFDITIGKDPEGKITYLQADLSQPLPEYQEHFDLIVSRFVLNDVADYRGFLNTLGTVTKQSGRFVLSMNNPYSFVVRGHITDYFETGKAYPYRGMAQEGVKVHFYHRTLEEYLAAASEAGFQLQRLVDLPTPEGSYKLQSDALLRKGYHFPFFMVLSFIKL